MKKLFLVGALSFLVGMAHADYTTYKQAMDAARPLYADADYIGAQKAIEEAFTLAKTPSEKAWATIRIGLTYNKRKLNEQAREKWTQVLRLPDALLDEKLQAQSFIAASYGEEKNWRQSRTEFEKVLGMPEITPEGKATARYAIALSYLGEKNEVDARKVLSALAEDISVNVNMRAPFYTQLAELFLRVNEFEKAYSAFTSAVDLPGVSPQIAIVTRTAFAEALKKQGNKERAQEEFSKAQLASFNQAKALGEAGRFAEARAAVNAALTLGQASPFGTPAVFDAGMRMEIAQLFLKEGKPQDARGSFEAFLQKTYGTNLTPQDQATLKDVRQSAQLGIARSYVLQQNKAQAQKVLTNLLVSEALNENVKKAAETLLKEVS